MHRHLFLRGGPAAQPLLRHLPPNGAMDELAGAIGTAAADYGAAGGVMLMVVQPGERNAFDQQWLQLRLWELHGVRTLRRTLREVREGRGGGGGLAAKGGDVVCG